MALPPATQGHLALDFRYSKADAKTTMHVTAQEHPLRVVRAFTHQNGAALAHLHNVSGGVLGGDCLSVTASIGPNAKAQLTTPGATRIYRHRAGLSNSSQTTTIYIEPGGLLELLPESIIPFAQARYNQHTQIHLSDRAGLFWWEVVAPGRIAYQELFDYDHLEMKTEICAGPTPIALERLQFSPKQAHPTSIVRLGGYQYWATFYICQVGVLANKWQSLEAELADLGRQLSHSRQQSWGISRLVSDGLVIRGLGMNSEKLMQALTEFWRTAKLRLYQEEIFIPRKLL